MCRIFLKIPINILYYNYRLHASKLAREGNQQFQAVGLLNNVIKKANQGVKPMIRCELLLEDMISILKLDSSNPFLRKRFGSFAVQIILNRFLSVPYYFPYVSVGDTSERNPVNTRNTWKILLKISIQLFEIIPENLDFHSCCAFLYGILSNGLLYTNLQPFLKKQFKFFESVMQSPRLQKCSLETKKIFLEIINLFIITVSPDCRQQSCIYGESVLRNVISLYDDRITSSEVIKFLKLQMILHHPNGDRAEDDGVFLRQSAEWKEHLLRVYTNLVDTTIQNQSKSNKSRAYGTRDYFIKPDLAELAADICFQLFLSSESKEFNSQESIGVDVTQIVPLDVTQKDHEERSAPKRRKISMSFKSCVLDSLIFEHVSKSNHDKNCDEIILPYLQIINRILEKFPNAFDDKILDTIGSTLLDLIQDCKNIKVKAVLLECSESLLNVFYTLKRQLNSVKLLRLWEAAVNSVSLNQCIKEGNSLLR